MNIECDNLRAACGLGIVVVQDNAIVRESLEVWRDDIWVVPTDMVEAYNNDNIRYQRFSVLINSCPVGVITHHIFQRNIRQCKLVTP